MSRITGFRTVLDTDFSVFHDIDNSYTMDVLHFHDVFEIYFARMGGLKYFVDNRIYLVEKNDIFIFNHLDLHRIDIPAGTRYERCVITFNRNYIKDLCTETTNLLGCFLNREPDFNHRVHLSDKQAAEYTELFEKAGRHIQSCQYGADIYKKITLAEILIFVNSLYHQNTNAIPAHNDEAYKKIKPVIDYINENISDKLSLDHMANQFYINKSYLCKLFRKTTGFTINYYIQYRRIIKATELLRKNLSVTQTAEMTGFKNDCHFITTFKKIVGISPKQYAKRNI